jgi:hypothetical protein
MVDNRLMDKIQTDVRNSKWHTLWKKRMEGNKPREGDYNFVVWKKGSEFIIEPWDKSVPPSKFSNGQWIELAPGYKED